MHIVSSSSRRLSAWFPLFLILLIALSTIARPTGGSAQEAGQVQPAALVLSGRVYAGTTGVEPPGSVPLQGATLLLYGSSNPDELGAAIISTTTNFEGWYGLAVPEGYEFYTIVETNPAGYTSDGATSVDGQVLSADRIRYELPLQGKTLTGNKFWDRPLQTYTPTASPTRTATPTITRTPVVSPTRTSSPTITRTPTLTRTPLPVPSVTSSPSPSATPRYTTTPTVTPSPTTTLPPDCPDLILNGGFEEGLAAWGSDGAVGLGPGLAGELGATLGGQDGVGGELWQAVEIAPGTTPVRLTFWWRVESAEAQRSDTVTVIIQSEDGAERLLELSGAEPAGEWRQAGVDLTAYAGQTVVVTFFVQTDDAVPSTFTLDQVMVNACPGAAGWTFTGQVRVQVGDAWIPPSEPVLLGLFGSNDARELGLLRAGVETGPEGEFTLRYAPHTLEYYAFLNVAITDDRYHVLEVFSESGGRPSEFGWLQFAGVPAGTYGGNTFVLVGGPPSATATPTPSPSASNIYHRSVCASAATFVRDTQPDDNFLGSPELWSSTSMGPGEGVIQRILLYFDLSFLPSDAEVQSAELQMLLVNAGGLSNVTLSAYAITDQWEGHIVTWTNQPFWATPAAAQVPVGLGAPTVISWDVRDLVRDWTHGMSPNYGIEIQGPEGAGAWWRMFDGGATQAAFCPRLELTLFSTQPVATLTSTPNPTATATPTAVCPYADTDNDTFAGAATLVSPSQGYICPSNDVDYWKFSASNLQNIIIGLANPPGNPPGVPAPNYDLCLVRPDGSTAYCSNNLIPSYGEYINYKADATGQWRAVVRGAKPWDWNKYQPYTLTYSVCNQPDEAANYFDGAESQDTNIAGATSGNIRYAYLCPTGDEDWFKFAIPSAYVVTMTVDLQNLPANYDLELYRPNKSLAAKSQNSGTTSEKIVFPSGQAGGEWRVRVYPGTSGASSAIQAYHLQITISGMLRDLTVDAWEVTQGIQRLANDVPLVGDKPTYVRVYGRQLTGPPTGSVECRLVGTRGGVPLPGSPLAPLNGTQSLAVGQTYDRAQNNAGWLFQLPSSWVKAGNTFLRAEVDPKKTYYETNLSNNIRTGTFAFYGRAPVCLVFVPVRTNAPAASVTNPNFWAMISRMKRLWPVANVWSYYMEDDIAEWQGDGYGPYELPDDTWKVLLALDTRDNLTDDPDECDDAGARTHYVGMVHAQTNTDGTKGSGRKPGSELWIKMPHPTETPNATPAWNWPQAGTSLAHELGHNRGMPHVNCGSAPDPGYYPYPPCQLDNTGQTNHYGFDVNTRLPIAPNDARDLMAYGDTRWSSDYTWKTLYNAVGSASVALGKAADGVPLLADGVHRSGDGKPNLAASEMVVLVSGAIISTTAEGYLDYAWVLPPTAMSQGILRKWQNLAAPSISAQSVGASAATYHLRAVNAQGQVLDDRAISLNEIPDAYPLDVGAFTLAFPAPAGAVARLELMDDNLVLATLAPGPSTPQVQLLQPVAHEFVDQALTVRWQASDADAGDVLHFALQYSADGGGSWQSLTTDVTPLQGAGSFTVTLTALDAIPGGTEGALVRVLASDGYHTGIATSAPFAVPDHPPLPYISSPLPDQHLAAGETVSLVGGARDPEDGAVPDEALTWLLNGREVGSGAERLVDGLAPGGYEVALLAVDSRGQIRVTGREMVIDPLHIPARAEPDLDGYSEDAAYADALQLRLAPYEDGSQATVRVLRAGAYVYLYFAGLERSPGEPSFAGLRIDPNGSGGPVAQGDDYGLFVNEVGVAFARSGDGSGGMDVEWPGSVEAIVVRSAETWSAEMRVPLAELGVIGRGLRLSLGHYGLGDPDAAYHWPYTARPDAPESWGVANLEGWGTTVALPLVLR